MLVETALTVFDLDYLLDILIATFFLNFTYLRLLVMTFIAETIHLLVKGSIETF